MENLFSQAREEETTHPETPSKPTIIRSRVCPNSNCWNRVRSSSSRRDNKFDDAVIQEHALAAASILFRQQNGGGDGGSLPFDRSASQCYLVSGSKKNQLPRTSSSRSRSSTDPLLQPHQFLNHVSDFELHFID